MVYSVGSYSIFFTMDEASNHIFCSMKFDTSEALGSRLSYTERYEYYSYKFTPPEYTTFVTGLSSLARIPHHVPPVCTESATAVLSLCTLYSRFKLSKL